MPLDLPVTELELESDGKDKHEEDERKKKEASEVKEVKEKPGIGRVKKGQVGKLKVYKSGKVKLHLGANVFDVSPALRSSFAQEAASMSSKRGSARYTKLADITHRVMCTPDLASLPL